MAGGISTAVATRPASNEVALIGHRSRRPKASIIPVGAANPVGVRLERLGTATIRTRVMGPLSGKPAWPAELRPSSAIIKRAFTTRGRADAVSLIVAAMGREIVPLVLIAAGNAMYYARGVAHGSGAAASRWAPVTQARMAGSITVTTPAAPALGTPMYGGPPPP